jgi:hypothetical protein
MNRSTVFILAALAALPAAAQAPKPTGTQILDKNVAAGGGAAWQIVQSFTAKGTISVPAQSISGTVDIFAKAPNKFAMKQSIKGVGDSSSAFDGTIGWSKDAFSGLRELKGAELAALKAQSTLALRPALWKTVYSSAALVGTVKVNGASAYKVKLTPKTGSPETQYFDVKTGLQVRSDQVVESPQGKIPVESYLSDYRTVNGIKMPFKTRQLVGQAEIVIQLTEVKINAAPDESVFVKPKE